MIKATNHTSGNNLGLFRGGSERDAQYRSLTRNATKDQKGGQSYTFCKILPKDRGWKYDIFLIFAQI